MHHSIVVERLAGNNIVTSPVESNCSHERHYQVRISPLVGTLALDRIRLMFATRSSDADVGRLVGDQPDETEKLPT